MPEKKARFALRSFAATVLVSLCAAAPAAAASVTISGSTDVRTCWIATDGVTDIGDCSQAVIGRAGSYEFRGLIHFDIAAHVPTGASVTDAYLRLPLNGFDDDDICASGLHLRAQDADWLGQTPTWASPDGGSTQWDGGASTWAPIATYESACDVDEIGYDVTGDVQTRVSYPQYNFGWTIVSDSGTPFGIGNSYTDIPELVIEYDI